MERVVNLNTYQPKLATYRDLQVFPPGTLYFCFVLNFSDYKNFINCLQKDIEEVIESLSDKDVPKEGTSFSMGTPTPFAKRETTKTSLLVRKKKIV